MSNGSRQKIDDRGSSVALYHVVYREEDFKKAAQMLFELVREAQIKFPNKRRCLYLDIEGHRNAQGGFDADMYELQKEFLVGFLGKYLSEMHSPLLGAANNSSQDNAVPEMLNIGDENTDAK